jgi:hypothetical protein
MKILIKLRQFEGTPAACAEFARAAGAVDVDVMCKCCAVAESAEIADENDGAIVWMSNERAARELAYTERRACRECYTGQC